MSSRTLYRWSGIALLIGSLFGAISSLLDTILYPGHQQTAQQILSALFLFDTVLFLAWALLLAMGLPGFYLRQAARSGGLGFAGFVLIWLGILLGGVVFAAIQLSIFPYLAQLKAIGSGSQPPLLVFLLEIAGPSILLSIGAILLGIATMRAHVFPRQMGILLISSGALFLLSIPPIPSPIGDIIGLAGNLGFFLALGWGGYILLMPVKEALEVPELSTPAAQINRS